MATQIPAAIAILAALACGESPDRALEQESAPPAATTTAPARMRNARAADQAFERGRQLMEQHCGDCYQRSLAGALAAVKELQQAVALGRNDAEVHRLLRDAYNGIAYIDYGDIGQEAENLRYVELTNKEIRIIAELDPADLENRMRFVKLLGSNAEKLAELTAITTRFPKYAFARYRFAQILIEEGDVTGAAAQARRWLELADPKELNEYSGRLFASADEERVRQVLKLDPKLHPASFELASRALRERREVKLGLDLGRASLEDAPPIVANAYLSALTALLTSIEKRSEAAALRNEYATKATSGEVQRRQFY